MVSRAQANAGGVRNEEGKAQEAAGQLNDLGKGIQDRVSGTVGGAVAGLTGKSFTNTRLLVRTSADDVVCRRP